MKVSIIIAVKEYNDLLKDCLFKCSRLAYDDFEIIVVPDEDFNYDHPRVRVVPSGSCLPAKKRDLAAASATGEILAFLDDDSYPAENWLTNAVRNFQDEEIAAVGGPGMTPSIETFLRKGSGLVYESFAVSGNFRYRYRKEKRQFVDDFPSCNLFVRKSVFDQLGGFKTNFWPGEDTILCLEIANKLKKKIIYDPGVVVFHHRRELFMPHLDQIKNYALHRGYFVKKFPQTSFRWQYFIPSLLLTFFSLGLFASMFNLIILSFYLFFLVSYILFIFYHAYQENELKLTFFITWGIFLTHIFYGLYFILGLLQLRLREEDPLI
jgi:GT2 family glycosyltransferase